MSPYMKKFVYASLFYLGLATIFGILDGLLDLGYFGSFAHTHFSLLGFMAMIVFGIGYFILPRFNGTELRFESWVPVHFWLANFSLIGMVVFRGLTVETGEDIYHVLFVISASLQVISAFMFIINIWVSLTPARTSAAPQPAPQPKSAPPAAKPGSFVVGTEKLVISVTPDTKVAFLVDTLPSLKDLLIEAGLKPLAQPGHIDHVREKGVPLGIAARNHGMDLDSLIAAIKEELHRNGFATERGAQRGESAGTPHLTANTLIGEVIRDHPRSRDVFQRYFGDGCFDCPGQAYESIDMACRMHGVDPDTFLTELRQALS